MLQNAPFRGLGKRETVNLIDYFNGFVPISICFTNVVITWRFVAQSACSKLPSSIFLKVSTCPTTSWRSC